MLLCKAENRGEARVYNAKKTMLHACSYLWGLKTDIYKAITTYFSPQNRLLKFLQDLIFTVVGNNNDK